MTVFTVLKFVSVCLYTYSVCTVCSANETHSLKCFLLQKPNSTRLRPLPVLGIGIGPIPLVSVWYRYRRYCSRYQNRYLLAVMRFWWQQMLFVDYSLVQETKLHRQGRHRLKALQISIVPRKTEAAHPTTTTPNPPTPTVCRNGWRMGHLIW